MASQLDANQVIQAILDETAGGIKISSQGSAVNVAWDHMGMVVGTDTVANDKETYTFRDGGPSGTIVKTVEIVYTDGNRTVLSSVSVS
jgi:hypothetical protein